MFAPRGVGSWLLGKKRNNNRDTSRILFPDPSNLTHTGVQTVTSRYEIESPCVTVFELNINAGRTFTNASDVVAENSLDLICDSIEDRFCQIATWQAEKTITKRASNNLGAECASGAATFIHKFHAIDDVTHIAQPRDEVHPPGDIKSNAPEIDHVTAFAELRCPFDQHRFESPMP